MSQTKTEIKFFNVDRDEYGWLSNFAPSPVTDLHGVVWPTVEHAFQAAKCDAEEDRIRIFKAGTPLLAKRLGRKVPLPADWEQVKLGVMLDIVFAKFKQNPDLADLLIGTDYATLVEDAPNDSYWGAGSDGQGQNELGKILMKVREELRHEQGMRKL